MSKQNYAHWLILAITFFVATSIGAQNSWEHTYGTPQIDYPTALTSSMDGGYLMVGYTLEPNTGKHDAYLVKTDADGKQQWTKTIGKPNIYERAYTCASNTDGSFIVAGVRYTDTSTIDGQAWIFKISALGDTLWSKSYLTNFCTDAFYDMQKLRDGTGYILTGNACVLNQQDVVLLMKVDLNGNLIWQKNFSSNANFHFGRKVIETSDGGFIVGGVNGLFGTGAQKSLVLKTDKNGNQLWQKLNGKGEPNDCYALIADNNGGCYATGVTTDTSVGAGSFFVHFAANGDELWRKRYSTIFWTQSVAQNKDGGFSLISGNYGGTRLREILKTDALGNIISQKQIHYYVPKDEIAAVIRTPDSSFVMVGSRTINNNPDFHLLKVGIEGEGSSYSIKGKIYADLNSNCTFDASEKPLPNWLVKLENDSKIQYGLSDSSGNYQIFTDSSNYRLSLVTPINYWMPCVDSIYLGLSQYYSTHIQDFAVKPIISCPLLDVDVATPFLRRCYESSYTVRYCNRGTATAKNVIVRVTLDKFLKYNSSTQSVSNRNGNILFFNVGDIGAGVCGDFKLNATLNCDSPYLGQTHCVEAHIFPDSLCVPTNNWSGANISVTGVCQGDSVVFNIKNVGTGTTKSPIPNIVIIDDVQFLKSSVNLPPNGSKKLSFPATGQTFRLISDQEVNYPIANQHPTAVVEGCRAQAVVTPLSLGYVTQFDQNDGDPFTAMDCHQNIGSFDPNDKQAQPVGIGQGVSDGGLHAPLSTLNSHFVDERQEINYTINFQNTGTDTAFTVVVRDTLSSALDLNTFRAGASSHKYTVDILESKILKFTFNKINLPDSARGKTASQGFIKFAISLKRDVAFGTRIENKAAIVFDFNAPIITKTVFHTLRKPQRFAQNSVDLCANKSYKNKFYTKSTQFYDTLSFAKFDSITINALTVLPFFQRSVDTSAKFGSAVYGVKIQRDTVIAVKLMAKNGCDSIVTYNIRTLTATLEPCGTDVACNVSTKIYPNPFNDKTTIEIVDGWQLTVDRQSIYCQLSTVNGQLLLTAPFTNNKIDIQRNGLAQGVYFFKIATATQTLAIGKIIITE